MLVKIFTDYEKEPQVFAPPRVPDMKGSRIMTSQSPAQSTAVSARKQKKQADRPIILHYVPGLAVRQGRRSIALCGQPVTCDQHATSKGLTGGNGIICPMCDLERERLAHRYRDPDEPIYPLAVSLGLQTLMEDQAGLTVCELADRAGLDPRELNQEIKEGNMPIDQMKSLAHACGTDLTEALSWINAGRKAIETIRCEDREL